MKSKEKLWDVCMDVYRDMYKQSTPKADFDHLIEIGTTKQPIWFMKYELGMEESEAILNHHCKSNKLTKHETSLVSREVYLGCAPKFK